MGKSKAPPPPDPRETAGAQTAQNVGTAIAQSTLNNVNQVTPDGTLSYEQTGTQTWRDPNTGATHYIPQYTATQTLSDTQQQIKDQSDEAEINLATLANDQTSRMSELFGTPFELSNDEVEGRLIDLGRSRLDPALDRRRESLRTTLSQQGIKEGSEAYDRAMSRNAENENDAYNQLMLNGRSQALQEALTERNQPINETSAFLTGSQVSQPNFVSTNPAQLGNVDVAGLINSNYNQRLAAHNQQQAQRGNIMGGLFGVGSALLGGF